MAPLSNWAEVCGHLPEIAGRLQATQTGGAIHYRRPERAEHKIVSTSRPPASCWPRSMTGAWPSRGSSCPIPPSPARSPCAPPTRCTAASPPAARNRGRTCWEEHLQRWYRDHHASTLQHDALTLSAALELPFVHSATTRIMVDDIGRWSAPDTSDSGGVAGRGLRDSRSAGHPAVMAWLEHAPDPATVPAAAVPADLGGAEIRAGTGR